uniref:Uncharacterized protein n=1 Tax=Monopterus albus TaxID=43700 RepID=A0A3Q3J0A9_MONAL
MYLNREENNSSKGSVSLSVFLVSLALTVCAVWLVALCGVCGWCQRKLVSLHTYTQIHEHQIYCSFQSHLLPS